MNELRHQVKTTLDSAIGEERLQQIRDLSIALNYVKSPAGRDSAMHLLHYRDAYKGKRCFIIGNGPSLRQTPLHLLRNEVTFGLNRIYLMFDELGYQTTFLTCVNRNVIEQFANDLLALPMPKFFSWAGRAFLPAREDVTFLHPSRRAMFSPNPLTSGMWEGATVTFTAMQLAFYMGFQQVVLVGVDHSFSTQGEPHKLVTSDGPDPNHFSPDYFGKGVKWQLPDLETSEIAYRMADAFFRKSGRSIVDATVGGHLTVFPKRDLKEIFDERQVVA